MRIGGGALRIVAVGLVAVGGTSALSPALTPATAAAVQAPVSAPALGRSPSELNVPKAACGLAGVLNKGVGIACGLAANGGALLRGGKQLLTGNVGGAVSTVLGGGTSAPSGAATAASYASTTLGLFAIGTWVVGGAAAVLHATGAALGATTTPQLHSTWFSATYWRMAAIAAMLTLPFLFAATVQALVRSDALLLARAALGYLPLAILAIAIAAPVTTLLLSASDELCALISSAAGHEAPHLISLSILALAGLGALTRSPFLPFLIGLFTIGAAFALWVELLLREAAVYVVVLMLPLAFAALAWPARRIWAVRAVEILVALILSKFAIIAVLSLGGAALSAGAGHLGVTSVMAGTVLIVLAALSPWALVRLVPLAEVASAAMGPLRGEMRAARMSAETGAGLARSGDDWAMGTSAAMRRNAEMGMAAGDEPPQRSGSAAGGNLPTGRGSAAGDEPRHAGAGDRTSGDPEPPPARERPWSVQPALELGPKFGETPVWPHPDAE